MRAQFARPLIALVCVLTAFHLAGALAHAAAAPRTASRPSPRTAPREGDFVLRDFHFRSGETLPELRIHYLTLGTPARDNSGAVTNAVLVLHGTGGTGRQLPRVQVLPRRPPVTDPRLAIGTYSQVRCQAGVFFRR